MSLVNHSVTNLINGVSQQAPTVRLDNQVEEQINCFSDVTRGLIKRNGLELKNLSPLDIEGRFKIAFELDGVRHMVALDGNDVTPLKYVPLSADVDALGVLLTSGDYFKDMTRGDLQILEDKDRVYLLNRKKTVGAANEQTTYFDIKTRNDDTTLVDSLWDTGEYTLTFDGAEATGQPAATGQVVVTVNRNTTLQDIADAINNDVDFSAEAGPCTVSGTIDAYRITFTAIPYGYTYPTLTTNETVAITYTRDVVEDSGWLADANNHIYFETDYNYGGYWKFGGSNIRNGGDNPSTYSYGGYTYYRGDKYHSRYIGGEEPYYEEKYKIKRVRTVSDTDNYTVESFSPSTAQSESSTVPFIDEAMIWVTGVSANQTYDVDINYSTVDEQSTYSLSLTQISVGTAASNIKLNWVAGQIQSQINGATDFTASLHDNAVFVQINSGFKITSIEVTNNFDTTSINSVLKAVEGSTNGISSIENLPPAFVDGFKLRVTSTEDEESETNYYMKYDSEFKGWKEAGLDESRFLDSLTMPYIIEKEKIRQTGVVEIEPASWTTAKAGDLLSNKNPSFVDKTINDMFFYGSRLGFATDDTLVMSKIDDFSSFFRTTTSKTVKSDRVDIKLDSSKIGYDPIKHVLAYNGSLFINTGTNQSVLLVNNAFDLTSARLSEVSSFSLGSDKPMPVANGLYFATNGDGVTNIQFYFPTGDNTYDVIELTKHCPRYIKGQFKDMAYSSDVAVVSTFEDSKTLYIQNRYTQGGQMVQNAWHKWTLPYDVEHFYFFKNVLYIIMSAWDSTQTTKYTLTCSYSLKPQDVEVSSDEIYIGWKPYLDCHTKDKTLIEQFSEFSGTNDKTGKEHDTVALAYADMSKSQIDVGAVDGPYFEKDVSPLYYWLVDGNTNRVIFNDGTEIVFGNNTLAEFDHTDGYRYYKGADQTGGYFEVSRATYSTTNYTLDDMLYGVKFTSTVELSEVAPRMAGQDGYVSMNYATLMLRRMRLLLDKSGLFDVYVDFKVRKDYTVKYTGQPLGAMILGRENVDDINFNFPINGKSNAIGIKIESTRSTPFNLLSAEWQGQLITKGRNI